MLAEKPLTSATPQSFSVSGIVLVREFTELAYREVRYYFWIEPDSQLPIKDKLHGHIQFIFKKDKI